MKALFGLAALLLLSWVMADKSKIPEIQREINRKAWPWSIAIVGVVLFLFFGYPLIR